MPAAVTLSQLESHLWEAAAFLRRTIDAGDHKQLMFPLLSHDSPMEASVALCRTDKSRDGGTRRGKFLFINAVNEVTRERDQSFLTDEHLQRVVRAYEDFKGEPGFTRVVPIEEIRAKDGNLSIPLYVGGESLAQTDAAAQSATTALPDALAGGLESSRKIRDSLQSLLTVSAK